MTTVVFDNMLAGDCQMFRAPVNTICAQHPGEVDAALAAMQDCIDTGHYLAGYFSYELGYGLENRLSELLPHQRPVPLLWFGVFDTPPQTIAGDTLAQQWQGGQAYAGPVQFDWRQSAYADRFERVMQYIVNGDIYQANLSMRGHTRVVGDPRALYCAMRSGGGAYNAYIDDGQRHILSFSPELFFDKNASGVVTCKPMKGTAARMTDSDADDAAARDRLHASRKNRAENLMIVDLLRNDLGRIAQTGSVDVPELFELESYSTVHQMVSSVTATLKPDTTVKRLLKAVFPCGSVTGAPKIRAMQIIRELESSPRGLYCGAIGWFAPDHSARFNVAIRTLTITNGHGELGVGGGLVADSAAADEYEECRIKARYFQTARRPLKLIETLRWEAGQYRRLELHLQRLQASARVFGFPCNRARVLAALNASVHPAPAPQRVRLTLDEHGRVDVTTAPLEPLPPATNWRFAMAAERTDSRNSLIYHKTDWRRLYDGEHERMARQHDCDEVLFCNERGELTEGSRSNLFLEIDGELLTPAISSGLLPGCLRQDLLDSARCREAVLHVPDLARADRIYFGNSLRGLLPAVRV